MGNFRTSIIPLTFRKLEFAYWVDFERSGIFCCDFILDREIVKSLSPFFVLLRITSNN